MAATARHPGFESLSCQFFSFLLSIQAGCLPYINIYYHLLFFVYVDLQVFVSEFPEAVSLLRRSCSVELKSIENLDPLLLALQTIERVLEEEGMV